MGDNDKIEQPKDPEVQKYLKKIQDQNAMITAMQQNKQQVEQEMMMAQEQEHQMKEQQWDKAHFTLIDKFLLSDLYYYQMTGNSIEVFHVVNDLCLSLNERIEENRMQVDKDLVEALVTYNENKDDEHILGTVNAIFKSLSFNQRGELVKLVLDKGEFGPENMNLRDALHDSIYNTGYFM